MKTRIVAALLLCVVLLTSCVGVRAYPTSLAATSTPPVSNASSTLTATGTPTPTPTVESTWTPETLYGFPTPQTPVPLPTCDPAKDCLPPLTVDPQRQDLAFHETYLGKYLLTRWCDVNHPSSEPNCAITISSRDNPEIVVWGIPVLFGGETGDDLTGRGKPDIVVIRFWGRDCCVWTTVYEAGETLEKIMDIDSEQPGKFMDLNGDGVDEFVFKADRRVSQLCSVCTVWAPHVYEYRPGSGYVPATYKFKELLSHDIQLWTDDLSKFAKANPNMPLYFPDLEYLVYTPTVKDQEFLKYHAQTENYDGAVNALYNLVVLHLLAGEPAEAQRLLSKYSPPEKASDYLIGIQEEVRDWLPP